MTARAGPVPLAIETAGLTKRFGNQVVVDSLDLAVPTGSVFGFLGPNGSGKTTTIRMLLGLAAPTSGSTRLLGAAMPAAFHEVLPQVGAVIEGPAFYPYLSGRANLVRYDTANRRSPRHSRTKRVAEALARVGLAAAAGKRYRAYSLGMRQRLALAAALLQPRALFVLDEPTNGLDPQGTREVRSLVREVAGEGATVFVSSHLLSEVEQICSHVAVMSAGRLVHQGTIADLRKAAKRLLRVQTPDVAVAVAALARLGMAATADGEAVTGELDSVRPEDACAALVGAGVRVRALVTEQPSLEDSFLALTGEGFDVAR